MGCGAEQEANDILDTLLEGEDVSLPDIDLNGPEFQLPADVITAISTPVTRVTNEDLTQAIVGGSGTFDILMTAYQAHLENEFKKNRIIGAEYTKTYIALTEAAMSQSVTFLLQRDQAFWGAQQAQIAALTAQVQLETAKMQLANAKFDALTAKSNYGLTKMKLSTESMAYCTAKYQLEVQMPVQTLGQEKQNAILDFQLSDMLPTQKDMVLEQIESQRAQTIGTRSDGTEVGGVLGKQIALYAQQITSYQRDAEVKAAKLWTDAWITMKTIDEGLEPPDAYTNANLDIVLGHIQENNDLA